MFKHDEIFSLEVISFVQNITHLLHYPTLTSGLKAKISRQ